MTTLLIADDSDLNRGLLRLIFEDEGHHIVEAQTGTEALEILRTIQTPVIGLIDWEMPGLSGTEVCRLAREKLGRPPMYLLLLTVKSDRRELVIGLCAGAHDYIIKPFDHDELLARVAIGAQIVRLQQGLIDRVRELQSTLEHVKILRNLLPICPYCKRIRDEQNDWREVESYMVQHSMADFTHCICPDCFERHVQPQLDRL